MPRELKLTIAQRTQFRQDGLLRLEGRLSPQAVRRARDAVLRPLATIGLWRENAWRLPEPRPQWPSAGLSAKVIGNKHPEVAALLEEPGLSSAVETLLDGRAFDTTVFKRPQVLFTLPNADGWTLPSHWHVDVPRLASGEPPGVQLFAFLDRVEPHGGGTVTVAGSHRLFNDGRFLRNGDVGDRFRAAWPALGRNGGRDPWRPGARLPTGVVGDVPLEVVEMTGAPGDAYLIDLRVLHSAAPNAASRPRMMITHRFVRTDLLRALLKGSD